MSQNDNPNWTHFNVRCEIDLKTNAESAAKIKGQSLSEWIRRAMINQLRLDDESSCGVSEPQTPYTTAQNSADEALDARIEATLRRLLAEGQNK